MNTPKTPMGELIEWIDNCPPFLLWKVKDKATELLEKEKQMVIDAVIYGAENEFGLAYPQAEDYYNKKFKNDKS